MKRLYAHTKPGGTRRWHTLEAHLCGVGKLCAAFSALFGAESWGLLAGWLHDVGKGSAEFQALLEGLAKRVDHSTAGGQLAFELLGDLGAFGASLAAFPIMGHHGGLPDGHLPRTVKGGLKERTTRPIPNYDAGKSLLPPDLPLPDGLPRQILEAPPDERGFAAALFIRMLFSCLTDADWLDTERDCDPKRFARRPKPPALTDLLDAFNTFSFTRAPNPKTNPAITAMRRKVQTLCRQAAALRPGCYSLTVPTGGGKTFASLAFALEHAVHHGLRRIIYVIPFTSIIEQNAAEFRKALGPYGEYAVLEHHSGASAFSDAEENAGAEQAKHANNLADLRLAAENWDASLVATTAVQFFESLFACRPSTCRKLHNLADSVIILDEAQMLPPELLNPCVMALRELVRGYGATVVLCTATQPALNVTDALSAGFPEGAVREIIPQDFLPGLFAAFRRVRINYAGVLSDAELGNRLSAATQVLCIVNTRKRAREVFAQLGPAEGHYHLSARMYPEHRRRVLAEIRERLRRGRVCRVVSTSLIEAGVDIDFPAVFREAAGLDSIAQAAGRCNREGRLPVPGLVAVFMPESGLPGAPFFQRRAAAFDWVREHFDDLLSPEAVQAYFARLYKLENLDAPGILSRLEYGLDEDLEEAAAFPFREIAADFTFINDGSVSLIVECDEALPLLARLEATDDREEARALLRRLQSFGISVFPNELRHPAVRAVPRYGLHVLSGATGYSESVGFVADDPYYRETERNIF